MNKITCLVSSSCVFRTSAIFACAGILGASVVKAGEAPASSGGKTSVEPAQEEPTYDNWVNFSLGGLIVDGDKAQFKQEHHLSGPVFGGIEDLHYEKTFANKTTLTIDGRAIFDNSDYLARVNLARPDLGYVTFGYREFRTWYDANGGFFPSVSPAYPNGQFFDPRTGNELSIDRRDFFVEFGLRVPSLPELTLRYERASRYGQKDSTEWASTALTGVTAGNPQRKIVPSFRNIDETLDIITLEGNKTVFGNTDLNLGVRYEKSDNNDSLNTLSRPKEANQRFLTQVDQSTLDMINGHFSSVTRFSDGLWTTAGYSYTNMKGDIGGSRISSFDRWDASYLFAPRGTGFLDLRGGSQSDQHVLNFNLMWVPLKDLTIAPAVRLQIDNLDADAFYTFTSTEETNLEPFQAKNGTHFSTVDESLEIRYSGLSDILLYGRGDWQERNGDVVQNQTNPEWDPFRDLHETMLSQKYSAGANWYPLPRLNFALQYYYKTETANYDWPSSRAGFQGVINRLEFDTHDLNARVTVKPFSNLSLVSRYDAQFVTIHNAGIGNDDPLGNGGGTFLPSIVSANITNNMFTESAIWYPWSRVYIQGNASIVLNQTRTPASSIILRGDDHTGPSVLNFKNNYWTLGGDIGFALNDKTDLHASYNYYRADDYQNNAADGMPYGAGATETTVSASIVRKLRANISVSLRYSYYSYRDETSGFHNNYTANMIYSGLQFRF